MRGICEKHSTGSLNTTVDLLKPNSLKSPPRISPSDARFGLPVGIELHNQAHAAITRRRAPFSRGRIREIPEDVPAALSTGTKSSHPFHYLRRFPRPRGINHP